jgi:LemA protein
MNRNISNIIQSAYGRIYGLDQYEQDSYESDRYELEQRELVRRHRFYLTVWKPFVSFTKNHWVRITLITFTIILAVGAAYYYNLMLAAQYDVQSALGNVNALMERRHDTSINLSKSVYHYTIHESTVLTNIVKMRADMTRDHTQQQLPPIDADQQVKSELDNPSSLRPAQAGSTDSKAQTSGKTEPSTAADHKNNTGVTAERPAGLKHALMSELKPITGLLALAEDHPDLKSSAPFLTLMTSLTDVEKDLSAARLKYNDMVNVYTTIITKFPINIFAKVFDFKSVPYYTATSEAAQFQPIDY